jgi:hypothetical protein
MDQQTQGPQENRAPRPVGIARSSGDNIIVVLDDGSMWEWWPHRGSCGSWEPLPPIPGTSAGRIAGR